MSEFDLLTLSPDDRGAYTLTFRRPEVRNALNPQAFTEIIEACGRVAADPTARVLVVTGEGVAFSAGADFDALQDLLDGDSANAEAELRHANAGVLALASLEIPTVAALNGDAFGGGVAVSLAADFRIMHESARLGFVFARLGLSGADTGATWWLTRLVGPVRALEIVTLGAVFDAEAALAEGLVTSVTGTDAFDVDVDAFVDRLAALAPMATRANKRAFAGIAGRNLAEQLDHEAVLQAEVIGSADFREGLAATREKRQPVFGGT